MSKKENELRGRIRFAYHSLEIGEGMGWFFAIRGRQCRCFLLLQITNCFHFITDYCSFEMPSQSSSKRNCVMTHATLIVKSNDPVGD